MNIQIFGTSKCFDTKKAQRYFKERGIKFQMIDLKEKGMSRGEFDNVARALGGWEALVNPAAKDKQTLALLDALVDWQKEDKLFENQQLFKTPIVRNGRKATVGYQPEIWKDWLSQKNHRYRFCTLRPDVVYCWVDKKLWETQINEKYDHPGRTRPDQAPPLAADLGSADHGAGAHRVYHGAAGRCGPCGKPV